MNRTWRCSSLLLSLVGLVAGLGAVASAGRAGSAGRSTSDGRTINDSDGSAHLNPGWQITCLDCPHYFTEMSGRSAVLDSQERMHIAYGHHELYYAREDGAGGWAIAVADDTLGAGRQTTIALDAQERPHILYQAADDAGLNHAWFDGTTWQRAFLAAGRNPWLVSAPDGSLHATFLTDGVLHYAAHHGGGWQIETLTQAGGYPSLALDSQGRPHAAYGLCGRIYHATVDGQAWQMTMMDDLLWSDYPAIAIDADDHIHIVHNSGHDTLVHRRYTGAGWETTTSDLAYDPLTYAINEFSLASGNNGHLYLAWSRYLSSAAYYPWYFYSNLVQGEWDGNDWRFSYGSFSLAQSTHASLVLTSQNEPRVAHKRGSDLAVADLDGVAVVDRGGRAAGETTLARGPDGAYHALYHNSESDRFIYLTTPMLTGPWTLAHSGLSGFGGLNVGVSTELALAVGPSPTPGQPAAIILHHIYNRSVDIAYSYYDGQSWLRGAFWNGAPGYDAAFNRYGQAHVVFSRYQGGWDWDLVFASWEDASGWKQGIVDVVDSHGAMSLAMDSHGAGHIAYDGRDGLRYARQTAGGWVTETVRAGSPDHISLALDGQDRPRIAWYDTGETALMYASHDGAGWQLTEIDDAGAVGQFASLVLDSSGQAHIAYYDATRRDLKYAHQAGETWHIETLVSAGDVGSHASMLLLAHDFPAIAYLDQDREGIMLIYRPFVPDEFSFLPLAGR